MSRRYKLKFNDAPAGSTKTITDGTQTVTFSGLPNTSQDYFGEWFVQGPVTVTGWTPAPTGTGDSARNGGMVNPSVANQQGFDGRINTTETIGQMLYSNSYNKAFDLPFTLSPGESLIIADSKNDASSLASLGGNPQCTSSYMVVSCVASLPAANSLRPPWAGTWKPIYNISDVNTSLLGVETGMTDPSTYGPWYTLDTASFNLNNTLYLNRKFIDPMPGIIIDPDVTTHLNPTVGLVPSDVSHWYPREWGRSISQQMLYTMGNFSRRNEISYQLVRQGVDYMAHQLLGWRRYYGAGFVGCRKGLMIYAGKLLTNPTVNGTAWLTRCAEYGNIADASFPKTAWATAMWPEDINTYYTNASYSGYTRPSGLNPRSPTPSGWPGGDVMYGDNLVAGGANRSYRDPAGKYLGTGGVNSDVGPPTYAACRYQATDNADGVTGNQTFFQGGEYMHEGGVMQLIPAILTNRMLGVESSYNNQALLDFVDWWMSDNTLRVPARWTNNAAYQDIYSGGSGNGYVADMWAAHR